MHTHTNSVVPSSDDPAAAASVAAAAAAAALAVGTRRNASSSALSLLPPASAAAVAMERSGSAGSLSFQLDASGGSRGGSGRLSRMPSFRLPSLSLLSGAMASAPAAAPSLLPPAQLSLPVPSASALQLQHLLGVELTAEEEEEREQAGAGRGVRPSSLSTTSSSSATSSEAASSEDGEGEEASSPAGLLLEEEEEEEEVKTFEGRGVEEEEELLRADPHLALAREVVMELKRAEKADRPPASPSDAAAAALSPPKQGHQAEGCQQVAATAASGAGIAGAGAGAAAGLGLPPLMRAVIVDWVLDIHARLKLGPQSLYLAVLILDRCAAVDCTALHCTAHVLPCLVFRILNQAFSPPPPSCLPFPRVPCSFTAQVPLDRPELQLLALASLLVASKHEDVTAPSVC